MCGIGCRIQKSTEFEDDDLQELLQRRGPDAYGKHYMRIQESGFRVEFTSTVLALRGCDVVKQPLIDSKTKSVLCWNGEAWKLDGQPMPGNDTLRVFDLLLDAVRQSESPLDKQAVIAAVVEALGRLRGPYAFVYYEATTHLLFFGRDCLGRRSLVQSTDAAGNGFMVSSLCSSSSSFSTCEEVEADGVYFINLSEAADAHSPSRINVPPLYCATKVPYCHAFPPLNRDSVSSLPAEVSATAVHGLHQLLHQALVTRATDIRTPTTAQHQNDSKRPRPARVAILFSGGLDCTVLACILDGILPASLGIDLLNVAFENPRIHTNADPDDSPYESCPDRVTARKAHAELCVLCPRRAYTLVEIDIPYAETLNHRHIVKALMHPHNTEMDLSIAIALYFAARGIGKVKTPDGVQSYTSAARVLISGLGADELFGGYQRHGTAFRRQGFDGLLDELELDFTRLGKRNLGRDDRVMSHWGKEVRFPYLDEEVVSWALAAPVWDKCGFGLGSEAPEAAIARFDPEKRVLRLLAQTLGLSGVAAEKKRAIQFGTRSAKMEAGNIKGTQTLA